VTKVIPPPNPFRGNCELLPGPATERRWVIVRRHIPAPLSAEADAALYGAIIECCSRYLTLRARYDAGRQSATALQKSGSKGVEPLAQLAKHLQAAADIWSTMRRIHDDRLGGDVGIDLYDKLGAMAKNAERWHTVLDAIEHVKANDPWPQFVVLVSRACRKAGLKPKATGRMYEEGAKPTWFQEFMAELDKQLLGSQNLVQDDRQRDHRAFDAGIAKALRGDKKPGNTQK